MVGDSNPFSLDISLDFSIPKSSSDEIESLLIDKSDPNLVYSLGRNGVITSWDLSNRRVVSNISIPSAADATMTVADSRSVDSLYWLEEHGYLVLFHGALYYWNTTTLDVLFCSSISNYHTNPDLLQIIRICVTSSLVFVAYQYLYFSSFYVELCKRMCFFRFPKNSAIRTMMNRFLCSMSILF